MNNKINTDNDIIVNIIDNICDVKFIDTSFDTFDTNDELYKMDYCNIETYDMPYEMPNEMLYKFPRETQYNKTVEYIRKYVKN